MKVTMLLADAAQAIEGKLYILGGGWSIRRPEPTPMAFAIKIEVPWTETNHRHQLRLALFDEDGQSVRVPTPMGEQPFEVKAEFEVGRPIGVPHGAPLDVALAINIAPIALRPNCRYTWRYFINDSSEDDWQVAFSTMST
jgi:hypothetical protein